VITSDKYVTSTAIDNVVTSILLAHSAYSDNASQPVACTSNLFTQARWIHGSINGFEYYDLRSLTYGEGEGGFTQCILRRSIVFLMIVYCDWDFDLTNIVPYDNIL